MDAKGKIKFERQKIAIQIGHKNKLKSHLRKLKERAQQIKDEYKNGIDKIRHYEKAIARSKLEVVKLAAYEQAGGPAIEDEVPEIEEDLDTMEWDMSEIHSLLNDEAEEGEEEGDGTNEERETQSSSSSTRSSSRGGRANNDRASSSANNDRASSSGSIGSRSGATPHSTQSSPPRTQQQEYNTAALQSEEQRQMWLNMSAQMEEIKRALGISTNELSKKKVITSNKTIEILKYHHQ